MVRLVSLFVLVLLGTVLCNHVHESEIDDPKLGTFEGTFTTAHGLLNICQDGKKVQGYYNEVGLIQGGLNEDGSKANGEFFFAGHGNCIRGTFELELTSWGLEGFFICSGRPGVTTVVGTKLHPFRPTDSQCGLLWEDKSDNLEGRWTDAINNDLSVNICFRTPDDDNGDDDDETVQGSMKVITPTGEVVDQFISGFWGKDGRVLSATWYQDLNAGAILMWLRNNGDIDYSWWTGLVLDNGDTYIEYAQANNPLYHGTGTYKPSPNRTTTFDECTRNEILQYFVLKNLPRDDDDNYYYFLDTQYIDPENVRYVAQLSTVNAAAGIAISFAAIIVGVLAIIF